MSPRIAVASAAMLTLGVQGLAWDATGLDRRLSAQVPAEGEVRQIVTFRFTPGRFAEAMAVFRDEAVPLYRANDPMLSFRGFREVESSVPLDLIVVSAFRGMSGMDASNDRLRELAAEAGSSVGAIYGRITASSQGHTDQFVEMLPELGGGDPSASRLTAFVWYRVAPGQRDAFESRVESEVADWEASRGTPSSTGRLLVSDGWDYLRLLGFESLGEYQRYWSELSELPAGRALVGMTARRREVIVASVPALSVR